MTHLYQDHRRVLLVDDNVRKLKLRAAILRNHEVEVHTACGMTEAEPLWKTIPYDLVLLAMSENPELAATAAEQVRKAKPRQRVGLLVGPPAYIREITRSSEKQPKQDSIAESVHAPAEIAPAQQWREMIHRILGDWYTQQSGMVGSGKLAS